MKLIDLQIDQWCYPLEVIAHNRSPSHTNLGIICGDEKPEVEGGKKTLVGRSLHLIGGSGMPPKLIDRADHPFGSPLSIYSISNLFVANGPLPPRKKDDLDVEGHIYIWQW